MKILEDLLTRMLPGDVLASEFDYRLSDESCKKLKDQLTRQAYGSIVHVTNPGKRSREGIAGEGSVTVYTDVEATVDSLKRWDDAVTPSTKGIGYSAVSPGSVESLTPMPPMTQGIGIEYRGENAGSATWLQIVWREVIVVDDEGNASAHSGDWRDLKYTVGGTATSEGTPTVDNLRVDVRGGLSPFYGDLGPGRRSARTVAIYDQPSASEPVVSKILNNPAVDVRRIISRAHFETYLIQDQRVQGLVKWKETWEYDRAGRLTAHVRTVDSVGPESTLPATRAEALVRDFPDFSMIK